MLSKNYRVTDAAFKPSIDELNNFVAATAILAVAFITFKDALTLESAALYTGISAAVLLSREIGQRTIAHWMEADVVLNLSTDGSAMTLFGAMMSFMTNLPVILLFPIFNSFDVESYEHWGKSIDAMWMKRRYWIVSSGILGLFGGWALFKALGLPQGAQAASIFLIFQLLPFDYSKIPTGRLDGAVIIRWSGFIWLIFMGLAILSLLAV